MTDGTVPPDDRDMDFGSPIAILSQLDHEPSPGFLVRVRKKIDRRVMASEFASFSWHIPKLILLEFLGAAFALFRPQTDRKQGGPR